jgi:ABC-type bacteriocin/lantibiotic exporter with double-glycine peptidase domain
MGWAPLHSWILVLVSLIAAAVALMAVYGVGTERRRARRYRREAQLWADLVSRHRELDQELEKVWQSW